MTESFPFHLRDADAATSEAPYTFFVPLREERIQVSVGDLVKLGFEYEWETQDYGGERMWVKVTGKSGLDFTGTLANEPWEPGLQLGLEVAFGIGNILDIEWDAPELHPPFHKHAAYWERCLVDDCVLNGIVPAEYVYREEPDMTDKEDKYPDSGWRIRGQDGHPGADPIDNRSVSYVALGAVLNKDDSFLDLLKAPVGSAFMRDFAKGQYFPAE
ncbi:immunity protein Imm33 domain-containing protein [Novosphingobium sp. UBA1939]|uniref:immunity protein Imm33 domain-containing protein n=1 Tax=Novosphingobium sp. UBA1939 TaxID=1946982 RepID=UPI0025DE4273|nr:DUF2185 domain-containing protein [Novosphingobium sp. UBA1939]